MQTVENDTGRVGRESARTVVTPREVDFDGEALNVSMRSSAPSNPVTAALSTQKNSLKPSESAQHTAFNHHSRRGATTTQVLKGMLGGVWGMLAIDSFRLFAMTKNPVFAVMGLAEAGMSIWRFYVAFNGDKKGKE